MTNTRIAPIARIQHGLVTTAQARSVLGPDELEWLLRARKLEPVRRSVYRVAGAPITWHQHLLAACLARPGAYASFRAAAALWGLEGFSADQLEITVPGTNRARLDGVTVHESRVAGPRHVTMRAAIPVASAARTLCDLTAISPHWVVERAVDEGLRRKIVNLRSLRDVATALDGQGRRRCTVMREILEHRTPGYEPGESNPERRIANLLVRAGLPKPKHQHRIRIEGRAVRVDLAYPDLLIAIEYDGWAFHGRRRSFDADRARANQLEVLGWTVLRFTSRSTDELVVRTVDAAIRRATGSSPVQNAA